MKTSHDPEKLAYLEQKINLLKEDRDICKNLMGRVLEVFNGEKVSELVKQIHSVGMEALELKVQSDKIKVNQFSTSE